MSDDSWHEFSEYQLLIRVLSEQSKTDGIGKLLPKDKSEITAASLQNPSYPDATRRKAGKDHKVSKDREEGWQAGLAEGRQESIQFLIRAKTGLTDRSFFKYFSHSRFSKFPSTEQPSVNIINALGSRPLTIFLSCATSYLDIKTNKI